MNILDKLDILQNPAKTYEAAKAEIIRLRGVEDNLLKQNAKLARRVEELEAQKET